MEHYAEQLYENYLHQIRKSMSEEQIEFTPEDFYKDPTKRYEDAIAETRNNTPKLGDPEIVRRLLEEE
jgi:ABC-type transporter MlaC component